MATIIEVTGLLQNGTAQQLGAPRYAAKPVTVQYRQLSTLRCRVFASNGVPLQLDPTNPNEYLVLSVRKDQHSSPIVRLQGQKMSLLGPHVSDFAIGSNVWGRLPPKTYRYDIWVIRSASQDIVVPYSYFTVGPGLGAGPITPDPIPPVCNGFDFGKET